MTALNPPWPIGKRPHVLWFAKSKCQWSIFADRRKRRTRAKRAETAERIPIGKAVAILGVPLRTVQEQAARGEIPGAAKIGRRWTFDIGKLRRLVKQREQETWQSARHRRDVTGGVTPYGRAPKFAGATTDGRFTQVTRRLRGRNTKPGGSG